MTAAASLAQARTGKIPTSRLHRLLLPACAAVVLVHACGMLPAQIRWAHSLLSLNGALLDVPDALRLITVSPVRLYGNESGAAAPGREALWLVLFLTLLCAGAAALLRRLGTPRTAPPS